MKKLSALVLALVMAVSMIVCAHAAPPAVEGTWVVNTATYTELGAQYMNETFGPIMPDVPWAAGVPYPAVQGACYIFSADQFSSTVPASSSSYVWLNDSSFQAGDAVWTVSVSGDTMILTETVLGTAYSCTRVAGSGGGEGGAGAGAGAGSPNTADSFSLGLYTTVAVAALVAMLVMKKKSRA